MLKVHTTKKGRKFLKLKQKGKIRRVYLSTILSKINKLRRKAGKPTFKTLSVKQLLKEFTKVIKLKPSKRILKKRREKKIQKLGVRLGTKSKLPPITGFHGKTRGINFDTNKLANNLKVEEQTQSLEKAKEAKKATEARKAIEDKLTRQKNISLFEKKFVHDFLKKRENAELVKVIANRGNITMEQVVMDALDSGYSDVVKAYNKYRDSENPQMPVRIADSKEETLEELATKAVGSLDDDPSEVGTPRRVGNIDDFFDEDDEDDEDKFSGKPSPIKKRNSGRLSPVNKNSGRLSPIYEENDGKYDPPEDFDFTIPEDAQETTIIREEPTARDERANNRNLNRAIDAGHIVTNRGRRERIKIKGEGAEETKPLSNFDIEEIMKPYKSFLGVVASDQIDTIILPKVREESRQCFIYNTDKAGSPGKHWIACFYDARPNIDKKSIEVYDSLAQPIQPDVKASIFKIVEALKADGRLKYKYNTTRDQSKTSSTCGYFATKFLMDRMRNKTWKVASNWTESDIKDFATKYKFI